MSESNFNAGDVIRPWGVAVRLEVAKAMITANSGLPRAPLPRFEDIDKVVQYVLTGEVDEK